MQKYQVYVTIYDNKPLFFYVELNFPSSMK